MVALPRLEIVAPVSSILHGFGTEKMSRGDHVQNLCAFCCNAILHQGPICNLGVLY
jgi:hypothetical protein